MLMARPWVRGDMDHPSCIPIYLSRTMLCPLPVRATPGGHVRLSKWWMDNHHLSKHATFDFLTMTWKMLTHREILTIMWALKLTPCWLGLLYLGDKLLFFPQKAQAPTHSDKWALQPLYFRGGSYLQMGAPSMRLQAVRVKRKLKPLICYEE